MNLLVSHSERDYFWDAVFCGLWLLGVLWQLRSGKIVMTRSGETLRRKDFPREFRIVILLELCGAFFLIGICFLTAW